ncbi:MAG: M16 family metallopeptidase [Bacteroidota bacterium]
MKTLSCFFIFLLFMRVNASSQINIKFEQYKLDNGLTVVLHEDHSAPVAAVVVMYHVGSKNEKVHRTGFAHLFEHMMFKGSEHVKDGEHFKLLQEIGANINGFTQEDGTTYFEVVPSNYTELGLYLESDRMGYLLGAVNQQTLDNQRDVVKNERRQSYDNQPYGTASEKIAKAMYPSTHPYSWPVIGYMEDLSAASLEDVKDFFRTYYAPNNAILVLAGDLNPEEAKTLVQKYFGGIPRGKDIERPKAVPVSLAETKMETFEDKVQLPRLYISWHSAQNYTREDAVLDVLGHILGSGKTSRLYKSMIYEKQIAQSAFANESGNEIAGTFDITVTSKPGHDLNEMLTNVDSIMNDLFAKGVTQEEIDAALTASEVQIINSASTEFGKASAMARFYSMTGDPGYINHQMDIYKDIKPEEVLTVAKKYLKENRFMLSIVPKGKTELAVQQGK